MGTRSEEAASAGGAAGTGDTEGESAAAIIYKVSQACHINPQVILVTMQKEQSLIAATGKMLNTYHYQRAMGYGCPDTAPCNEAYFGLFNQIYQAAHRFHYYRIHPEKFRHRAGRMNDLLVGPGRNEDGTYKCGTIPTFIENQATAGLYNYTPYTPNDAALAAGAGLGDECSSYGNRNFYRFFTAWFGTTGSAPAYPQIRLAGANRIETAVKISGRAFAGGSDKVYIARADKPIDALSGGTLKDGPVLLVPQNGSVPASVHTEIQRLGAKQVIALGGTGAVSDTVLADAAAGLPTSRLFGPDRYSTAISISHAVYPQGAEKVYIADGIGQDGNGSPDAVVGGMLDDGPVLIINPKDKENWKFIASEISDLHVKNVIGLGGPGVVPDEALKTIADGSATVGRLYGQDRYETALKIASYAYPPATEPLQDESGQPITSNRVVYLARGDNFADALVAGSFKDGPVLLTPSRISTTSTPVHNYLARLLPNTIIALGGEAVLHPDTVEAVSHSVKAGLWG